jgi:nicotinamidase-related amidase
VTATQIPVPTHQPLWVRATTPYAWPWDGRLDPARLAVLVVTTGTPGPAGPAAAAPGLRTLADTARGTGALVVNVRTLPPAARATALAPGTAPTLFPDAVVVDSSGCDGFYGSSLDALLRRQGRDQLLLTGWWLETCVHSTLRTANDQGYECLTVRDACTALSSDIEPNAISSIEMSGGIFGAVGDVSAVLQALSLFENSSHSARKDALE